MVRLLRIGAVLAVLCSQVSAQSAPAPIQFAPIMLDQQKFTDLWGQLRKIEATADVHDRIAAIMNNLMQQAQKERALAAMPHHPPAASAAEPAGHRTTESPAPP